MKQSEIQDLIKFVAKAGVTEVEIEHKDFKITIKSEMPKKGKKGSEEPFIQQIQVPVATPVMQAPVAAPIAPAPAAAPAPAPAAPAAEAPAPEAAEDNSKFVEVKSPMIGTFYRSLRQLTTSYRLFWQKAEASTHRARWRLFIWWFLILCA